MKLRFVLPLIVVFQITMASAVQAKPIDFAHDVVPILKQHCVACHGGREAKGSFSLNTRTLWMESGFVDVKDPAASQRAGEKRKLKARPVLPVSPWILGLLVFVMSLCVIGTHGLLSGTATMDFGGRKAAGTTVGVIDGFVYLGTALQSIALGELTGRDWSYWPLFLLPFAVLGFFLLTRIWHAQAGKGAH